MPPRFSHMLFEPIKRSEILLATFTSKGTEGRLYDHGTLKMLKFRIGKAPQCGQRDRRCRKTLTCLISSAVENFIRQCRQNNGSGSEGGAIGSFATEVEDGAGTGEGISAGAELAGTMGAATQFEAVDGWECVPRCLWSCDQMLVICGGVGSV